MKNNLHFSIFPFVVLMSVIFGCGKPIPKIDSKKKVSSFSDNSKSENSVPANEKNPVEFPKVDPDSLPPIVSNPENETDLGSNVPPVKKPADPIVPEPEKPIVIPPMDGTQKCAQSRGVWVWDFLQIIPNEEKSEKLLSLSKTSGITDLFGFLRADDYKSKEVMLKVFIAKASEAGIRVWALEGYRGHFSDTDGPKLLYDAADAMLSYNAKVAPNQKFVGFQTDLEPQDGQGDFLTTFHNDLKDSKLNTTSGGVWQKTQALDREMLLRDWLTIQSSIKEKMKKAGLKLGAAMPSWVDDYYGEDVKVFYKGKQQGVMNAMMDIVDDYLIMSYSTNPSSIYAKIQAELSYSDTIAPTNRPKIYGGVETFKGIGSKISYGDLPGKDSRTFVLQEIQNTTKLAESHPSFCGINIHDWEGWMNLRD